MNVAFKVSNVQHAKLQLLPEPAEQRDVTDVLPGANAVS